MELRMFTKYDKPQNSLGL